MYCWLAAVLWALCWGFIYVSWSLNGWWLWWSVWRVLCRRVWMVGIMLELGILYWWNWIIFCKMLMAVLVLKKQLLLMKYFRFFVSFGCIRLSAVCCVFCVYLLILFCIWVLFGVRIMLIFCAFVMLCCNKVCCFVVCVILKIMCRLKSGYC